MTIHAIRKPIFILIASIASLVTGVESASAQLFGQRSMGQPLRPRPGPVADSTEVGTLRGNERFMRDNRSRNDFVGSSRSSQEGFVGSEQALGTGRVRSAAESVRSVDDASPRVNKPIPPLKTNQIYFPNLVLEPSLDRKTAAGFSGSEIPTIDIPLTRRLSTENSNVQVLREGRRAVLVGEVSDNQQAAKVRLMLSFEPGIYSIDDRIIVQKPALSR